jgi:hypothetical protein
MLLLFSEDIFRGIKTFKVGERVEGRGRGTVNGADLKGISEKVMKEMKVR